MAPNPKESLTMFTHDLHLSHTRHSMVSTFGVEDASSSVSISVDSNDLVAAWSEMLGRMSTDMYAALKTALTMEPK